MSFIYLFLFEAWLFRTFSLLVLVVLVVLVVVVVVVVVAGVVVVVVVVVVVATIFAMNIFPWKTRLEGFGSSLYELDEAPKGRRNLMKSLWFKSNHFKNMSICMDYEHDKNRLFVFIIWACSDISWRTKYGTFRRINLLSGFVSFSHGSFSSLFTYLDSNLISEAANKAMLFHVPLLYIFISGGLKHNGKMLLQTTRVGSPVIRGSPGGGVLCKVDSTGIALCLGTWEQPSASNAQFVTFFFKRYEVDGKGTNMIGFESYLSSLVKRYIY